VVESGLSVIRPDERKAFVNPWAPSRDLFRDRNYLKSQCSRCRGLLHNCVRRDYGRRHCELVILVPARPHQPGDAPRTLRKRSRSPCVKEARPCAKATKGPPFSSSLLPLRRAFGRRLLQRQTPRSISGQAKPRRRSCRASSTTCTAASGGNPLASPPKSPDGRAV